MNLGKLLGKIITAPIKIVVAPIRIIVDVVDSPEDDLIKATTDSIEKQIKEIVD